MKIVAKSSTFVCLSYQVQVEVFNPIPLIRNTMSKPIGH